ncbi:hypothetical protein [Candidatus Enterovibrio altilux]|uniref:Mobile element protein n=1 Tax=Candidatus Enterovibrio altilux TaxID=1927128 RepID=A0A291BBL1_9GAMM|nr:hypothetical protein [Candidatus Enterovibrio luxaltus]ATF10386.1 hypothetical protein BTN50_1971 [Candidatus Enterovibrio luxaltus]
MLFLNLFNYLYYAPIINALASTPKWFTSVPEAKLKGIIQHLAIDCMGLRVYGKGK